MPTRACTRRGLAWCAWRAALRPRHRQWAPGTCAAARAALCRVADGATACRRRAQRWVQLGSTARRQGWHSDREGDGRVPGEEAGWSGWRAGASMQASWPLVLGRCLELAEAVAWRTLCAVCTSGGPQKGRGLLQVTDGWQSLHIVLDACSCGGGTWACWLRNGRGLEPLCEAASQLRLEPTMQ
eukprot:366122-Chlamydomonas_euryale.AAC.16